MWPKFPVTENSRKTLEQCLYNLSISIKYQIDFTKWLIKQNKKQIHANPTTFADMDSNLHHANPQFSDSPNSNENSKLKCFCLLFFQKSSSREGKSNTREDEKSRVDFASRFSVETSYVLLIQWLEWDSKLQFWNKWKAGSIVCIQFPIRIVALFGWKSKINAYRMRRKVCNANSTMTVTGLR